METFLETSFQNVRSSKRTDEFHNELLNEVLNANHDWAELLEVWSINFPWMDSVALLDIDIAGFDSEGNLKVAILGKAINSNVNKNIKENYANTDWYSTDHHVCSCVEMEKVLFVTVLPRIAHVSTTKSRLLDSMMLSV